MALLFYQNEFDIENTAGYVELIIDVICAAVNKTAVFCDFC